MNILTKSFLSTVLIIGSILTSEAQTGLPVRLMAEAEDFTSDSGWQVMPYRENYFASTFAITFLSRMACLSAPEQVENGREAVATQEIEVPADGEYQVLARYEQPYQFSAEFTIEVKQRKASVYKDVFGRLQDDKIWGCYSGKAAERRKPMIRNFWGATDNIVWQHKGAVSLRKGTAVITLVAGPQMDGNKPRINAAKRNVDIICLTTDLAGLEAQKKRTSVYLENDGWLTQDGDLFLRMKNLGDKPVKPVIELPCEQHSPYYIHYRDWPAITVFKNGYYIKPDAIKATYAGPRSTAVDADILFPLLTSSNTPLGPGDKTGWIPIGQTVDALNNCGWRLKLPARMELEFGIPNGKGGIKSIKKTAAEDSIFFEIPGVINPNKQLSGILKARYWMPEIRTTEEALQWLLGEVRKFPKKGTTAKRFLFYSIMGFGRGLSYATGRDLALALGDNTAVNQEGKKRGILCHIRSTEIATITNHLARNKMSLNDLYIVSYGDETHLPAKNPGDEGLAKWLAERGIKFDGPVKYTTNRADPLYYYSAMCAIDNGAQSYIAATAFYKSKGVLTGANYSPHSNYLVSEMHYIRPFKMKALTMPWSEDYIWQVPEFSVQAIGYLVSAFRAGAKYHNMPIHMYVMPHSPGNTPRDFRLSFYTCVAQGAKMINYFCGSPMVVGGTENYVATDDLGMWRAIHDCSFAAGLFEDYIMDGKVRPARVGLLLSSVDDIMVGANNMNFAMHNNERKAVYFALRHAQVPVDFLSEDDIIDGLASNYKVIYITQQYLHSKAVKALTAWVEKGNTLVALVGGGFNNEFDKPNPDVNALFGVKSQQLETDPKLKDYLIDINKPFLTKQDLPLYDPIDYVKWSNGTTRIEGTPVIVWKQRLKPADGQVVGTFKDGTAAVVTRNIGKGRTFLFGFLPGQAYLKSGLPIRPVDRGSSDDSFTHFLPTGMDLDLRKALVDDFLPTDFVKPVVCSESLVETTCIDTEKPAKRLAVPLMNYSGKKIDQLTVAINGIAKAKSVKSVELGALKAEFKNNTMTVIMPLDVTDMLLIDR